MYHRRLDLHVATSGYLNGYQPVTKGSNQGSNQGSNHAWFSGRKSTKNHEIAYMQGARARVHLHACQKKSTGCQLMTPSTFWEWFAVRFLAVQRTEILLLHACCSKKLVCTCISIPFLEKLFSTLTRFFLYSCKFHTAVWLFPLVTGW